MCVMQAVKYSPIAQWIKRWPTDLVDGSLSLTRGEDLFNGKQGSIALSLSLLSAHCPDRIEILLKRR